MLRWNTALKKGRAENRTMNVKLCRYPCNNCSYIGNRRRILSQSPGRFVDSYLSITKWHGLCHRPVDGRSCNYSQLARFRPRYPTCPCTCANWNGSDSFASASAISDRSLLDSWRGQEVRSRFLECSCYTGSNQSPWVRLSASVAALCQSKTPSTWFSKATNLQSLSLWRTVRT